MLGKTKQRIIKERKFHQLPHVIPGLLTADASGSKKLARILSGMDSWDTLVWNSSSQTAPPTRSVSGGLTGVLALETATVPCTSNLTSRSWKVLVSSAVFDNPTASDQNDICSSLNPVDGAWNFSSLSLPQTHSHWLLRKTQTRNGDLCCVRHGGAAASRERGWRGQTEACHGILCGLAETVSNLQNNQSNIMPLINAFVAIFHLVVVAI